MDKKDRYITRGIREMNKKNPLMYLKLWDLYDEMDISEKDYLQVFELRTKINMKGIVQEIEHTQEEPQYSKTYKYFTDGPVEAKVYIIVEDDYSTMLIANEY
ncbi:DUF960 family protein [Clostridium sp.]|uniref:DUF960 family protein n=1 Tax=Clostridium sp. TaxID=1506 RepID=UPI001A5095E2|nr:DUF960 family protein [Clostridium sp.]MBK5240254.1 hypothetical protein [Clostridium sp.]